MCQSRKLGLDKVRIHCCREPVSLYLMKPSQRAAELQDPGSRSRLGLILAVEDHTQFLFKLSQARLDLDVGKKLINFFFPYRNRQAV